MKRYLALLLVLLIACSSKVIIEDNSTTLQNITLNITNQTIPAPQEIAEPLPCDCPSVAYACVNGTCEKKVCVQHEDCGNPNFYCLNGECLGNPCKIHDQYTCFDGNPLTSDTCDRDTKTCMNKEIVPDCTSGDGKCPLGCNSWKKDLDCGGAPQEWDMVASNNPNDYLGDAVSAEPPSDWREYVPITAKVAELTNGSFTELEKTRRIADWVKSSRPYTNSSQSSSIIDAWNAQQGDDASAALILTALLREANVPARSITTAFGHAYTEAYVNGQWIGIDATYGSGAAYVIDENSTPTNFSTITYITIPYDKVPYYETDTEKLRDVRKFRTQVTLKSAPAPYGYVLIPRTARQVFYNDQGERQLSATYTKDTQATGWLSCGLLQRSWDCDYYSCRAAANLTPKSMAAPGFIVAGHYGTQYRIVPDATNGYMKAAYPAGAYRFSCELGAWKYAYVDVVIPQDGEVRISPSELLKYPEASDDEYRVVLDTLKAST